MAVPATTVETNGGDVLEGQLPVRASWKSGVSVFSAGEKPRQKRTSTARTRTGCQECRRRHLKCDEQVPTCRRCLIGGLTCHNLRAPVSLSCAKAALPVSRHPANGRGGPVRLAATPRYESMLFGGDKIWMYFTRFVNSCDQGGTLPVAEIIRITPQVAHAEQVIREICCAIGSLAGLTMKKMFSSEPSTLQRDALDHYGRAVQLLRNAPPSRQNLMMAALASLLFTTYEVLNDDGRCAKLHFQHAHRLMEQYIASKCEEMGRRADELSFTPLENAMLDMLERLASSRWDFGQGDAPSQSERYMTDCCWKLRRYLPCDMPEVFGSATEASKWWDVTRHVVMHRLEGRRFSHLEETSPDGTRQGSECSECSECSEYSDENDWQHIAIMRRWHRSFEPLLREGRRNKKTDTSTYIQVTTLETLYIEILGGIYSQETELCDANALLPAVTPLFADMVASLRELSESCDLSGSPEAVHNESAIVRPLMYIVFKTRDEALLGQVRALLESIRDQSDYAGVLLVQMQMAKRPEAAASVRSLERVYAWTLNCIGCGPGLGASFTMRN